MRQAARLHRRSDEGFALIEVMLALMLIALLTAIALPGLVRGTGPASLRVTAFEISALLRDDRNEAILSGQPVTTHVESAGVRSGATRALVPMPVGVALIAPPRIRFTPDGRASGGDIVLTSEHARLVVAVSPDSGGIRVVAP